MQIAKPVDAKFSCVSRPLITHRKVRYLPTGQPSGQRVVLCTRVIPLTNKAKN